MVSIIVVVSVAGDEEDFAGFRGISGHTHDLSEGSCWNLNRSDERGGVELRLLGWLVFAGDLDGASGEGHSGAGGHVLLHFCLERQLASRRGNETVKGGQKYGVTAGFG